MNISFRLRGQIFALTLLAPTIIFVCVFAFYPIANSFYLSLHRIIIGLPELGSRFIGLENYKTLFNDIIARKALLNTLLFVFITTFFEILFGLAIAILINKRFKGRGLIRASILIPWAIPTVVSSQMWRFIFNDKYGLFNLLIYGSNSDHYKAWLAEPLYAFIAIIMADVWKTSSFAALLILAGLQVIPEELYLAAKVDGASTWKQFTKITLPLIRPALLIALLFRTMDAFRVFDLVFVMTQGGPADATNVLQFYGYKKIFAEGLMGYGSTISVLVFVVTFSISLFYIKLLGRRLSRGAS
jgi:multiple sugar transport system permease protein